LFLKEIKEEDEEAANFNIGAKYIQRAQIKQQPKKTSWKEKGFEGGQNKKFAPEKFEIFILTKVVEKQI
jgi:hypothetical protein